MKIGILSDVHADLAALLKALMFLDGQGAEQILCAGDLVDRGSDGDAVVALIREREIPCVQGNHDKQAAAAQLGIYDLLPEEQIPTRILKRETLTFLSELPHLLTFEFEGKRLALTHATPWDVMEYVMPDEADLTQVWTVLEAAQADIVILGHTHIPMRLWLGDKYILNPGSLSRNRTFGGHQSCAILSLPDDDFQVYDVFKGEPIECVERYFYLET